MRNLLAVSFSACATLVAVGALAQPYPAKPVKLIVTYPPGGSSDLMARVFGQKLGEVWGQTVIIESKPGAAGSIGMDFAAKQAPDGYSFVVGNIRSEEHTSELQSRLHLVCRLLLEKKKTTDKC